MKQKYTQSAGRRPFGIACLLTGFDDDGTPHLYQGRDSPMIKNSSELRF
jgi:20S proteasome subunit alpha 4